MPRTKFDASSFASQTTGELHLYANGSTGDDDSGSGLAEASPKRTLGAVIDLIPQVCLHPVVVHLRGTFSESGNYVSLNNRYIGTPSSRTSYNGPAAGIVFDGGPDKQIQDDNSGSNYTATYGSTTAFVDNSASFTVANIEGYLIEVLTGNAAGDIRLVHTATTTEITPHKDFSAAIQTGDTCRFVKPATTIDLAGFGIFGCTGGGPGALIRLQRLLFSSGWVELEQVEAEVLIAECILEKPSSFAFFTTGTSQVFGAWSLVDPTVPSGASIDGDYGISIPFASLSISVSQNIQLNSSFVGGTFTNEGSQQLHAWGSRFKKVDIASGGERVSSYFGSFHTSAGYAPTTIKGSAGVGLTLTDGAVVTVGAGCDIADNTTHGIEVREGSVLKLDGAVVGSGNGTSGVYAHMGAQVFIDDGNVPTIAGNSGTVQLTFDGTTQRAKWADIATSGQVVETNTDLLLVKTGL
jgi:hypothetical protein